MNEQRFTRRAPLGAPASFDQAARTVTVTFATGAAVTRRDWTGERWVEQLELSERAVDLSRLNAGAPVLNAHRAGELGDVIGVVERAWVDRGQGVATIRFSDREEVAPIVADVAAGIIRNVSVGYAVHEWREEVRDGVTHRTATRWTPMELSLVPRPLLASSVSAAAIFRTVERFKPTLLLDEADQWMGGDDDRLGILNAGHRRGAPAVRCVGDDAEPRAFDVFAPVALASIGRLPPTLQDRAIVVALRRALPDERRRLSPVRTDRPERFAELRSRCRRWADNSGLFLRDHDPELPESLSNRRADNWRPLFAIADRAGGAWPARVVAAAALLEAEGEVGEEMGLRLHLLADIREVILAAWGMKEQAELEAAVAQRPGESIATAALLDGLVGLTESPWGAMPRAGKPLNAHQLARMLRPWGIRTNNVKQGGTVAKHYRAGDFLDPFRRYLSGISPPSEPLPATEREEDQ